MLATISALQSKGKLTRMFSECTNHYSTLLKEVRVQDHPQELPILLGHYGFSVRSNVVLRHHFIFAGMHISLQYASSHTASLKEIKALIVHDFTKFNVLKFVVRDYFKTSETRPRAVPETSSPLPPALRVVRVAAPGCWAKP